jgi:8-oxo-dGTP pyrophosphatase MutT (NUDIX family)
MIPSDPKFGGSKPSIAKGGIDKGEGVRTAAVREAEEELGLIQANIKPNTLEKMWEGRLTGNTENYKLTIYTCEVDDKDDFNKPHYETGSTHWLTAKEFAKVGRESQVHIVAEIDDKL